MKYITNITDEPQELPSQIGSTVLNNPDKETIRSLGLIPIFSETQLNTNSLAIEDCKRIWSHNIESEQGIIAVYNLVLDKNSLINKENARYQSQLSEGFDTGLGFNLSMHKEARNLFREIMDGIHYADLPDETIYPRLKDTKNAYHSVTIAQLKSIAKGYSLACMQADALNDYNLST